MSQSESTGQQPADQPLNDVAAQPQPNIQNNVDDFFSDDQKVNELMVRLKEAETEVLKSHAEAENFRKRLQRDAELQLRYANMPLIRDLLDVVDNLNRATSAASNDQHATALLGGVQMVTQQLTNILAKFACKPIESQGQPFDPNFHEAISQMPSADIPAGNVAQEVAVGYTLHDRVVRPAQVIVSTGPA